MSETDLNEYFSRVRGGDMEAFATIYDELNKPVFIIVYRIVQSKEMAEDIMQDVFVKLFHSPPDPFVKNKRAWIFKMARNLAIDALRKKTCVDIEESDFAAEDELDFIVQKWDIESAIKKLPSDEREIISLHISCSMPFKDISHIIGRSVPTVYRKYRKAIKTLRDLLDGGNS